MSEVVLITGASSGLGQTLATLMAQKGYKVYGTSRRAAPADLPYSMVKMDVGDPDSVHAAVKTIIDQEGRLDLLINNAGIGIGAPIETVQLENVKRLFETNTFGLIRVCQAVLPHMRKAGKGKIINISSIAAAFGLPYRGIYSATKASADMITEALRMETKDFGIQLCSVQPGDFKTNISLLTLLVVIQLRVSIF